MAITLEDLHSDEDDNLEQGKTPEGGKAPEGDDKGDPNDPNYVVNPEGNPRSATTPPNDPDNNPEGGDEPGDGNEPDGGNEPTGGSDDDGGDDTGGNDDDVVVSGIEQYLSEFGIQAGLIEMEDEEGNTVERHFNELDEQEQFNVLKSLADLGARQSVQQHGLDEDEVGLINYIRSQEGTVEEILEGMAKSRLAEERALAESTGIDYQGMSEDAIYTKFIKEANPEATDEEVAEDLSKAKEGKFFEANVERMRESFIRTQQEEAKRLAAEEHEAYKAELEQDRTTIVNAVADIENVVGFPVDNDVKNEVLSKILEVGESGDSLFMEEVFSDPAKLFRVAYLHYKGEEALDTLDNYWKKEVTKAHKKGRASVTDGMPTKPISGRTEKPEGGKGDDRPPTPYREPERITLDELHDDV